jgi:hypothetical protein
MADLCTVHARLTNGRDLEHYDADTGNRVLAFLHANGSLPVLSAADSVTASADSNQAGGTPVTKQITRVTTVATAGDSLLLPAALAGDVRIIKNGHATNSIDIFPATGESINALSANAAYALAAVKSAILFCSVDGRWDTILTA